VLVLYGELDVAGVEQFRETLNRELNGGARRVVIDLSELEFIDAAGIAELVRAGRRAGVQGGDFSIRSPRPAVRRVLEITGVLDNLQVS
jgi:anti-anti-sigma factor